MKYIKHYQCTECGRTYKTDTPMNLCEDDGRPVKMMVNIAAITRDYPSMTWYRPHVKNMWRFGPLLPFDISTDPDSVCSLGEGYTPIIDVSQYLTCSELNLQVYLKDEGHPYAGYGANPTGSFKDRGMSVVVTMARYYGLSSLAVTT